METQCKYLIRYKVNANYFGLGAPRCDRGLTDNKNKQYKTALDYENFLQTAVKRVTIENIIITKKKIISTCYICS